MRTIIVTGASRGIGLAVVETLLAKNVRVVGLSRSEEPMRQLAARDSNFSYVVGSVTDHTATQALLAQAGRVDGIVFNAGVLSPVNRLSNSSPADWEHVYKVNVFAVLDLLVASIPHLRQSKGKVVFVSSGAANKAYQAWGAYGSSKAALNHMAMTLAAEEPEIVAIAVAPGVVDTEMQSEIRRTHGAVMDTATFHRFTSLKTSNQLLAPQEPATVLANLVLSGTRELSGRSVRYSDDIVAPYREL